MDVFGNSMYIPNQGSWGQTGYMPNLNSFTATNTTSTWSQTPPSNVPWGISYSQTLPNVIRFTGQPDIAFPHQSSISSPSSCAKRHLDDSDQDVGDTTSPPRRKQFISEEKMTAKMNEMHISNAFVTHCQESAQSTRHVPSRNSSIEIEEEMSDGSNNNSKKMPSLYFSEELKQLKASMEPIIHQSMLSRYDNSKALMLWTPRVDLWSETSQPSSPESQDEHPEFIRSDDPKCSVVITEITDVSQRNEDEDMIMDDL